MILIKGIELPKEPDEMIELAIFGDGRTVKTGESWRSPVDGKCYYGPSEDMNTYSAFTVHPHGRLIDANALARFLLDKYWDSSWISSSVLDRFVSEIANAPTIIPAEPITAEEEKNDK